MHQDLGCAFGGGQAWAAGSERGDCVSKGGSLLSTGKSANPKQELGLYLCLGCILAYDCPMQAF